MANFRQIMVMCLQGASYSQVTSSLGCSRRDVARVKAVIADESITQEVFDQLPPRWFSDQFSDCRRARKFAYDQPDFKALADKIKNNKHLTRHKLWVDYLSVPCPKELAKYLY